MDIDELFAKNDTFTADVEINIPGKKADKRCRMKAEFRYLDQDQIDALIDGDPIDLDGEEVEAEAGDAAILDRVLVGWTGFKAGTEEIEYSDENRAKALKHGPVRTPLVTAFFNRLSGGQRGGKRGRRKN